MIFRLTEAFDGRCFNPPRGSSASPSWDVREAIRERLATPNGDEYWRWSEEESVHLWMPNIGKIGHHLHENADFNLQEITAEQLLQERAAFTVQFQQELAILREAYGAAAVSIHWGVIQDYS